VLDEGKITDNLGNTIDLTHTIIIATSNAQARFVQEAVRGNMPYSEMQKQLTSLLIGESFRPEFINRFDGVIVFKPLVETEIEQIAKLKIEKMQKHLKENRGINLVIGEGVVAELAKQGYDPAFGARPLERVIREKVENKIANELLESDTKEVQISLEDLK
jgi:ATP-dependent Clp protease ATP-binding subunit ClpA